MEIEMRCAVVGATPSESSEGQHPVEGARRDIPPREVGSSEEEEDMIDPRDKRRQEVERLMGSESRLCLNIEDEGEATFPRGGVPNRV